MKNKLKKGLSFLLAMLMVLSLLPAAAFAEEEIPLGEEAELT